VQGTAHRRCRTEAGVIGLPGDPHKSYLTRTCRNIIAANATRAYLVIFYLPRGASKLPLRPSPAVGGRGGRRRVAFGRGRWRRPEVLGFRLGFGGSRLEKLLWPPDLEGW
jgi:hypothetical protein